MALFGNTEGAVAEEAQTRIQVAITIDDLPGSAHLPPGYDSKRVIDEMVAALQKHHVKSATGFVIGERLDSDPSAQVALADWTAAGFEVGNHSWSHGKVDELGVDGYVADAARLDAPLRAMEQAAGQTTRWFRYPYLLEGRTPEERKQVEAGLTQLGYTSSRVTMDFYDWAWGDPHARCLERGNQEGVKLLAEAYIEHALANLAWTVQAAKQVIDRPLPHVLLLHANAATAQNLDALLTAFEQRGVEFVSLEQAMRDPAYVADYPGRDGHVLTLASHASGRPLPPVEARSMSLLELACQ